MTEVVLGCVLLLLEGLLLEQVREAEHLYTRRMNDARASVQNSHSTHFPAAVHDMLSFFHICIVFFFFFFKE